MNWLLMILSFALGGLATWLWSVRTVTRVIPASEYDRHLDARYDDEDDALEREGDLRDGDVRDGHARDGAAGLGAAGVAGGAAGAAALSDRDDDHIEVDEDHGRFTERDDVALTDDAVLRDDAELADDVVVADERPLTADEDDLTTADEEPAGVHALGDLDDEPADQVATDGEFVFTDAEVTDADDTELADDIDSMAVAGAGAATGVAGYAAGSQLQDEDQADLGDDDVVDPASTATGALGTTDGDVVVVEEIEDVDGQPVGRSASDAHTEAIPMVGQGMTDEDVDSVPADDLRPVDADAAYADEFDSVAPDATFLEDSEFEDGEVVGDDDTPYGPGSARSAADGTGPEGWAIKGNTDSGLFHTEESPGYANTKAEVWFADEASAIAAGFRHWDRKQR